MKSSIKIPAKVSTIQQIAPNIKKFTLHPSDGLLPAFTAGSHVRLYLDEIDQTKAYSLINDPCKNDYYEIAVLLTEESQGGSHHMHHQIEEGDIIHISPAENFFPLYEDDQVPHVFIAGGIGITPFLSYIYSAQDKNLPFTLHYTFRDAAQAAFVEELKRKLGDKLVLYDNAQGQYLDVKTLLAEQTQNAHIYVCGPKPLIDAVIEEGERLFEASQIHFENFSETGSDGEAFEVVFDRSGFSLMIDENTSILQAIEADKRISVECLCRNGVCGTCETMIIEGEADHRDLYLDEEEQESQKSMMICVSRAKGKRIVLDL